MQYISPSSCIKYVGVIAIDHASVILAVSVPIFSLLGITVGPIISCLSLCDCYSICNFHAYYTYIYIQWDFVSGPIIVSDHNWNSEQHAHTLVQIAGVDFQLKLKIGFSSWNWSWRERHWSNCQLQGFRLFVIQYRVDRLHRNSFITSTFNLHAHKNKSGFKLW